MSACSECTENPPSNLQIPAFVTVSPHGSEKGRGRKEGQRERALALPFIRILTLMTPSKPNYHPKALSPNIITLNELGGGWGTQTFDP